MFRLVLVLGSLAALLPGAAQAKELSSATVCGAEGCRTVDHPPQALTMGDETVDAVPPPGAFCTVSFAVEHEGEAVGDWSVFRIPAHRTVRAAVPRPAGVS